MNANLPTFSRLIVMLVLAALLAACGGAPAAQPALTPEQNSGSTQPALPTSPPPTLTDTPTPESTATPEIGVYSDDRLGFEFSYPSNWILGPNGRLEGPDGFVQVEILPADGAGTGAVCHAEANHGKPSHYGSHPQIEDGFAPADCLILPSEDQPADRLGESVYLFWPTLPARSTEIVALRAGRDHIRAIVDSLRLTGAAGNQPASACDYAVQSLETTTRREDGLRIDEFSVAQSAGCRPLEEPEAFSQAVSAGPAAERAEQVIGWQWQWARIAGLNQRLAPFGIYVQAAYDKTFAIYQYGRLLDSKLNWLGPLSANASGTDFFMPVIDSYDGETSLLRPDGLHALESWDPLIYDRVFPVFTGDDQISAAYDRTNYLRAVGSPTQLEILNHDAVIETYSVGPFTPAGGPVRGLWAWDGHWVLELSGLVIQDGQILNDADGRSYSEMFTWRLLKEKPFYFYRQDGKVQAAYDNQKVTLDYDEVIHEPLCCMTSLIQMKTYENGLIFFARRGEVWYYVVLEAEAS